jgi:hypothetical protein
MSYIYVRACLAHIWQKPYLAKYLAKNGSADFLLTYRLCSILAIKHRRSFILAKVWQRKDRLPISLPFTDTGTVHSCSHDLQRHFVSIASSCPPRAFLVE